MCLSLVCIVLGRCRLSAFVRNFALTLELSIILLYLRSLDQVGLDLLRYLMLANLCPYCSQWHLKHTFPLVRSVWQMIWPNLETSLLLLTRFTIDGMIVAIPSPFLCHIAAFRGC